MYIISELTTCNWKTNWGTCKYYSLDRKVLWQSGAKEYHKVIQHNIPHSGNLLGGEKQKGGCLCWGKKQQRTEQKSYIEFIEKGVELFSMKLFRVEIGGISCPENSLFTL